MSARSAAATPGSRPLISRVSVEEVPLARLSFVDDAEAQGVINKIMTTARTGQVGDGKIFAAPLAGEYGFA